MRTQVGIVGAGPAGLALARLLHLAGIESVVLEAKSRDYCQERVRAGVLDQNTTDLLVAMGVGDRMQREGLVHHGINLRFGGRSHRIDFAALVPGRAITIYGQNEVFQDLTAAHLGAGGRIAFDAEVMSVDDFDSARPKIHVRGEGRSEQLDCDFIAGCDGFHGVCRQAIPSAALSVDERDYPFAWLGILAAAPPLAPELVYSRSERGFALASMRSARTSRLYLQCRPDENIDDWTDDAIWRELRERLDAAEGPKLVEGPILQKSVSQMNSFVVEPMQFGRLFLAGDAAHIVPATGAKGLNLAVADVVVLSRALAEFYASGREHLLASYSQTCLQRVRKVQSFADRMTSLLHVAPDDPAFEQARQLAELEDLVSSRAASQALAENYVGLPMD